MPMSEWSSSDSGLPLPPDFPSNISTPKFHIGDRVRWQPIPSHDFGVVVGLHYIPAAHLQKWQWQYVVWLDLDSPSRGWIVRETAWEDDLEAMIGTNIQPADQVHVEFEMQEP